MSRCRRARSRSSKRAGRKTFSDRTASRSGTGIRPDPGLVVRRIGGPTTVTAETALVSRTTARQRRAVGDTVFRTLTFLFALLVLLILGGVIAALIEGSLPALRAFGLTFITSQI